MSESVAMLAQIDQAPKTTNGEDFDFDKDNMTGNDTNDHTSHHRFHDYLS